MVILYVQMITGVGLLKIVIIPFEKQIKLVGYLLYSSKITITSHKEGF